MISKAVEGKNMAISNVSFAGRLNVSPESINKTKNILQELGTVLTDKQKDEFVQQLHKINQLAEEEGCDIQMGGSTSYDPEGPGELRVVFYKKDGGYARPQAWLVPGSKNRMGFRNENEISKLTEDLRKKATYCYIPLKKDNQSQESFEDKCLSFLG